MQRFIEPARAARICISADKLGYSWWGPGLTIVRLPVSELATACGLWFLHQLREKKKTSTSCSSISPPDLVIRGSAAAPAEWEDCVVQNAAQRLSPDAAGERGSDS